MVSMEERGFFADHYEVFLMISNIALMAMVIFFMVLSTRFQIGLLTLSAVILALCSIPLGARSRRVARPLGSKESLDPGPGWS
jgi:hypothetical protein